MARFIRNSALRAQGIRPVSVLGLRQRARRAETQLAEVCTIASANTAVLSDIATTVAGVKTPNGTTRKIARLLNQVAA